MYDFGPNETYVLICEALSLSQGCLLAYMLALGAKDPIKKAVDRVVFVYFFYTIFSVAGYRSMYRLSPAGTYDNFGELTPYLGMTFPTIVAGMGTFLLLFILCSMQLWYALLKRKADWVMRFSFFVIFAGIVVSIVYRQQIFIHAKNNVYLYLIFFPMYMYGLVIMWRGKNRLQPGPERKRLAIFFYAYFIPLLGTFLNAYLLSQKLIDQTTHNLLLLLIGSLRTGSFAWAIVIYGVFRMDLSYASEDIFESMDDPVLLLSPTGEVSRANASAQKKLVIDSRFSEDTGSGSLNIRQLLPNYSYDASRFEAVIHLAGDTREYSCANTIVMRQDSLVGSVLLFRDVTREKELARMKTDFTSTVSHELRTPLTSVLGFAKIIQKRFNDVIMPSYKPTHKKELRAIKQIGKNLEVIISESKRLTKLINDVLDISKMEAGRVEWRFTRCSLNNIIEQSIQATDGLFGSKPVSLVRDILPDVPDVVADSDRVIQVVINLISNAVKFTDQGTVTIKTELHSGNLLVHVSDTGTGISKADQKLVFEKYKQVGSVITDKPQGTGLGLPISKEIIEQHGGRIWVQSIPGEGTTFSFSLPLADLTQMLPEPISFAELQQQINRLQYVPQQGNKSILLIDDEASIRQILRQVFENAGYLVFEAGDGQSGLDAVYKYNPDLLILDVMMPKMNGFDVAATLKNDPRYMTTPIIMLTVVDDAQRIYGLGVELYLSKPFEPEYVVTEAEKLIFHRAKDKSAILFGQLAEETEVLRQQLTKNGYGLHCVSEVEELAEVIAEHQSQLLLVVDDEEQDTITQARLQKVLSSSAILTRVIKRNL